MEPEVIARRNCAAGVQAARRRPGDVAARARRVVPPNPGTRKLSPRRTCATRVQAARRITVRWRLPPVALPHPRAGGRGDGRRAAGARSGRETVASVSRWARVPAALGGVHNSQGRLFVYSLTLYRQSLSRAQNHGIGSSSCMGFTRRA